MPNDVESILASLCLLSIAELKRLRAQTKDWRVKAACNRRLWEKQHQRTVGGSMKATQLNLFGEG